MKIRLTPRALRQIEAAARWWQKNRHKNPEAFDDELDRVLELIVAHPSTGKPARVRAGIRRIHLDKVGYELYYRVVDDVVQLLALWHTSRWRKPSL